MTVSRASHLPAAFCLLRFIYYLFSSSPVPYLLQSYRIQSDLSSLKLHEPIHKPISQTRLSNCSPELFSQEPLLHNHSAVSQPPISSNTCTALLIFSQDVCQISNSLKPGIPIGTPSLRNSMRLSTTIFPDI